MRFLAGILWKYKMLIIAILLFIFSVVSFLYFGIWSPVPRVLAAGVTVVCFIFSQILFLRFLFKRDARNSLYYCSYQLIYRCPACGREWEEENIPTGHVCPDDAVPLITHDLKEDKNSYYL